MTLDVIQLNWPCTLLVILSRLTPCYYSQSNDKSTIEDAFKKLALQMIQMFGYDN